MKKLIISANNCYPCLSIAAPKKPENFRNQKVEHLWTAIKFIISGLTEKKSIQTEVLIDELKSNEFFHCNQQELLEHFKLISTALYSQ